MPITMHNNVAFCSRYTIGGYDGDAGAMTATVEFYEPRMPSWVVVEPMNYTRGYHASAVLGGSIFTFGGVKGEADTILDVVGTPSCNFITMLCRYSLCCMGDSTNHHTSESHLLPSLPVDFSHSITRFRPV
jgi:hypothetical protein